MSPKTSASSQPNVSSKTKPARKKKSLSVGNTPKKETSAKIAQNHAGNKRTIKLSNPLKKLSPSLKLIFRRTLIWAGVFLITLVIVDYSVQYLNYNASIAIVNGERLYRKDFYEELENTYGTIIASNMIDEALVYQEAAKKKLEVAENEIDEEYASLEKEYGGKEQLQEILDARKISNETLRHQIETTLLIEKILADKITVTEDEMKEFYEQNYTEENSPAYDDVKDTIKKTLRTQKLSPAVQTWIQEIREKATIQNNIDDPKGYGFLKITRTFFEDMLKSKVENK